MQLDKNTLLLIFRAAAKGDPKTRQAINCVSATVHRWMLSEEMDSHCQLKARLCQLIRQDLHQHISMRDKHFLKAVFFRAFEDTTVNQFLKLLKFTAHQNTLTYENLPADSDILKFMTERKCFSLSQLRPIEVYMLYLVEQHRKNKDPVIQQCLLKLQKKICDEYHEKEDHMLTVFGGLEKLCPFDQKSQKGDQDKFVYLTALEVLRLNQCVPSLSVPAVVQ